MWIQKYQICICLNGKNNVKILQGKKSERLNWRKPLGQLVVKIFGRDTVSAWCEGDWTWGGFAPGWWPKGGGSRGHHASGDITSMRQISGWKKKLEGGKKIWRGTILGPPFWNLNIEAEIQHQTWCWKWESNSTPSWRWIRRQYWRWKN